MIYFVAEKSSPTTYISVYSQYDEYLGKIIYHEETKSIRFETTYEGGKFYYEDMIAITNKMREVTP